MAQKTVTFYIWLPIKNLWAMDFTRAMKWLMTVDKCKSLNFFAAFFQVRFAHQGRSLLHLCNNHGSHLSIDAIYQCVDSDVIFFFLFLVTPSVKFNSLIGVSLDL